MGTQKSRITALVELGKHAEEFKKTHGKIPTFMSEYNEDFMKGVPKILKPYLLDNNSFSSSAEEVESIDYWCDQKPNKNEISRSEICGYIFKTKETRCETRVMETILEKS